MLQLQYIKGQINILKQQVQFEKAGCILPLYKIFYAFQNICNILGKGSELW